MWAAARETLIARGISGVILLGLWKRGTDWKLSPFMRRYAEVIFLCLISYMSSKEMAVCK